MVVQPFHERWPGVTFLTERRQRTALSKLRSATSFFNRAFPRRAVSVRGTGLIPGWHTAFSSGKRFARRSPFDGRDPPPAIQAKPASKPRQSAQPKIVSFSWPISLVRLREIRQKANINHGPLSKGRLKGPKAILQGGSLFRGAGPPIREFFVNVGILGHCQCAFMIFLLRAAGLQNVATLALAGWRGRFERTISIGRALMLRKRPQCNIGLTFTADFRDLVGDLKMQMLLLKLQTLWSLFLKLEPAVLWRALTQRIYSHSRSVGLRRDLRINFSAPSAKVPLSVRPLRPDDVGVLLNLDEPGIDTQGVHLRLSRLQLLHAKFGSCYVALNMEDG